MRLQLLAAERKAELMDLRVRKLFFVFLFLPLTVDKASVL